MRLWKSGLLLLTVWVAAVTVGAQTPAKAPGKDMQVQLTSSVKAKKAKVGDAVTAITVTPFTLAQGVAVPAESKVIGHVRKVEADSADSHTSFITLSFDELQIKKGQTVPLNCIVRAAMLPPVNSTYNQDNRNGTTLPPIPTSGAVRDGMGSMATGPQNYGNSNNTLGQTPIKPADAPKPTTAHTGEVVGMPGVELSASAPEHLSTFKSNHKNLELDEGLQLMLFVAQ